MFERETAIRKSQWYGIYWARWGDALVEAGLQANDKTAKFDSDLLLRKVAEAYRHHGRIATDGELALYRQRDPEFPWRQTIGKHYGTKAALIAALKAWTTAHEEYDPPSILWTPMLAFRSWRGVSDECREAPDISGVVQA